MLHLEKKAAPRVRNGVARSGWLAIGGTAWFAPAVAIESPLRMSLHLGWRPLLI
jgi:hypothetical protein